jgi:hypothetical protein
VAAPGVPAVLAVAAPGVPAVLRAGEVERAARPEPQASQAARTAVRVATVPLNPRGAQVKTLCIPLVQELGRDPIRDPSINKFDVGTDEAARAAGRSAH